MNTTKLDTNSKVLTRAQEIELIEKWKHNREALNRELISHNEKLVLTFAHKYAHAANYDDLVQEGMVGLAHAAKRFDINRNVKFSCYAYMYVKKYVLQFIYSKIRHDTISEDGKTSMVSMNAHVGGEGSDYTEMENVLKVRSDFAGESPSSHVQSGEMSQIVHQVLDRVNLSEQENYVLRHRILATEDKQKLETLAKKLNCSISNIKAIEYRIYSAIRQELAKLKIHDFSDIAPEYCSI
jgi:RNA polymerase sigma factor (sigma-70 family)